MGAGGLLGVGVFFTLSGYLITDLLVEGYERSGHLELRRFWAHRARRLLPALLVLLVVVLAWVTLLRREQLPAVRGAAVAALAYASNWWLIFQHVSYFARFGPPSPLGHLWSLAVEEQFYLIWPLLLGLFILSARRRRNRQMLQGVPVQLRLTDAERLRFAVITLVLASASALAMAVLYHPGLDTTRIYGRHRHSGVRTADRCRRGLLFPSRSLARRLGLGRRVALDLSGTIALAGIVVLIWRTGQYSPSTYRGGLVLLSVLSAVVVVCAARTASVLAWALGRNPLRWLGVRSYGIYLWHYPIIVLTTPLVGPATHPYRAIAQLAGTVVAAALSWRFVEEPIRKGALGRIWTNRRRALHWRTWSTGWRLSGLVAAVAVLATACVGASTVTHRASSAASANRPATTRPSAPPGQTSTSP